jgi:hypothetical protein
VGLKSLKSLNLTNVYPNKNKNNKNNNKNNNVKSKPLELAGKNLEVSPWPCITLQLRRSLLIPHFSITAYCRVAERFTVWGDINTAHQSLKTYWDTWRVL